jgi:hypothetical protein
MSNNNRYYNQKFNTGDPMYGHLRPMPITLRLINKQKWFTLWLILVIIVVLTCLCITISQRPLDENDFMGYVSNKNNFITHVSDENDFMKHVSNKNDFIRYVSDKNSHMG